MGIIFTFLLLLLVITIFSQTIPRKINPHGLVNVSRNFFTTIDFTGQKFDFSRELNRSILSHLDFRYKQNVSGYLNSLVFVYLSCLAHPLLPLAVDQLAVSTDFQNEIRNKQKEIS